ncbi:MAG: hypothetical protein QF368_01955 [SAR202 cluster bacterium]|nr:hypothetical protein [SAR202 cluster bacterium]
MNLFRSEEHVRNWSQYDPAWDGNLQPLSAWADRFSADMFRARARPDYISWLRSR